jgi:hypothetical protein
MPSRYATAPLPKLWEPEHGGWLAGLGWPVVSIDCSALICTAELLRVKSRGGTAGWHYLAQMDPVIWSAWSVGGTLKSSTDPWAPCSSKGYPQQAWSQWELGSHNSNRGTPWLGRTQSHAQEGLCPNQQHTSPQPSSSVLLSESDTA